MTRSSLLTFVCLYVFVLFAGTHFGQTTFTGTNTGPIPDGDCGGPGLQVQFAVSGFSGPPTNIRLSMTADHTWMGDLDVLLIAPNGTTQHFIFTYVGNDADENGDDSNLNGTYNFFDTATGDFWAAAAAAGSDDVIPPGDYRTTNALGPTPTSMNPVFASLATANGTWILKVNDCAGFDTGNVTAASLTITASQTLPPANPDFESNGDFDGDSTTDFAVVRELGTPGLNSQVVWWIQENDSSGRFYSREWGRGGDWFVPADYDGDNRADIAVWRPGAQGVFYIIRSQTNTIHIVDWGRPGDDPSVVGDYNGDDIDDLAVFRPGSGPGAQSRWFWRSLSTPASPATPATGTVDWGRWGDSPSPGDYDDDGRFDFVVQRNVSGNGVFYLRYSSGAPDQLIPWGTGSDTVVPGDYDGDDITDIAVMTIDGPLWRWNIRKSSDGQLLTDTWGLVASDYPAPGDYNGDGIDDYAVWRAEDFATFYVMTPVTRAIYTRQWGRQNDRPVMMTFSH